MVQKCEQWGGSGSTWSFGPQRKICSIDGRSDTRVSSGVQKCFNSGRGLIEWYGSHSKQKSSRTSNSRMCQRAQNSALCRHTVLCAEAGEKQSAVHIHSVVCWSRREAESCAIPNRRKISPTLRASTMYTAPVTTSRRAMIP